MKRVNTFIVCMAILFSTSQLVANHDNNLNFMIGTWKTEGTQYWGNGQWVEHKGIVKCELLEDGVTLERTFWAAFANGVSLGGKSVHTFDTDKKSWSGQWIPTVGNWAATPAIGRFEGNDFVEEATGSDQSGKYRSITTITDISEDSYNVSTDLIYDSGTISENNWNIKFTKIEVKACNSSNKEKITSLDFIEGEWIAEGQLLLPNATKSSHISYVEVNREKGQLEQKFWGAIGSGGALCGVSYYDKTDSKTWESQWRPVQGSPAPLAHGEIVNGKYIEEYAQSSGKGANEVVTTYHKLSNDCYKVQTDVVNETGEKTEAVWTVVFIRV